MRNSVSMLPAGSLLWLILLSLFSARLGAAPLLLDERQDRLDLSHYAQVLEDRSGDWQIADVDNRGLQRSFRPVENGDLHLDKRVQRYWFRFSLRNISGKPSKRIFEIRPAYLGDITVYARSSNDSGTASQLIPALPKEEMLRPQNVMALTVPPHSDLHVFVLVENHGDYRSSIGLYQQSEFFWLSSYYDAFNALMLGILCSILMYCVIAFVVYKEPLFINQVAFCILVALSQLTSWGYIQFPLITPSPMSPTMLAFTLAILLTEVIFAQRFPIYSGVAASLWKKLFRLLTALLILGIVLSPLLQGLYVVITLSLVMPIIMLSLIVAAINGFFVSTSRLLFYYLLATAALLASYLTALLAFFLGLIDIYELNLAFAVIAVASAASRIALLIARTRKRWHKQYQEAQRVAVVGEVNRAKSDILSRITHEIRTPISAIVGVTELLEDSSSLTTAQEEYLRSLQRSSHELLQLLEEAGQAARFSDSDMDLRSQIMSFPELVGDALAGFRNLAAERDLELIADISPELPSQLLGDPSRIRQLLIHSVNSAFEHSENGFILLKIHPASPRPGHIHIEVSHRGRPFDAEERQALYPAKQELHENNVLSTRFAIISRLVSLMRGQISVRSAGNRDLHTLCMSIQLNVASDRSLSEHSVALLSGKRLLVVDSNKTFCEVINKQCSAWGMTVFSAASEQAAIAILRNQRLLQAPLDFILIDHRQPENGLHLAHRIAEENKDAADHPSILLLAHANIDYDQDVLRQARVQKVLSKPLASSALRSALLGESRFNASNPNRQIDPQTDYSDAATKTLQCLIAEDNPSNALVLKRMLSNLEIEVQHAENGQQALNQFLRTQFDLVILDIEMPVMDGLETARQMRHFENEEGRRRTPIFGLSANALDEQRDNYLNSGIDLHLVKPIRQWELAEAIQRWTGYTHHKS